MNMSLEAIAYTLRCIADVAFPKMEFSVVSSPVPKIVVDGVVVKFPVVAQNGIDDLFSGNACCSEVKSFDGKVSVKVFSLAKNQELFSLVDGEVVVNADILTVSFALLSRCEEMYASELDKYGRFRYSDSLSYKCDFVGIPIVDEYALLLRKFVCDNFPSFSVAPRSSHFVPTHDIDFLFRFPNFSKSVKTIAGDLLKRKSLRKFWKSFVLYFKSLRDLKSDPYVSSLHELVNVSNELGLNSCFYFKALDKPDEDCTYDVFSSKTAECIRFVQSKGMGVGLHAGLKSYHDESQFLAEKENLEKVVGRDVVDVRQHFLRFDVRRTPQIWQSVGVRHDSTMGFPEQEGFRCGTCHPYRLYDVENDCVTDVVEHPLIVMDTTLFQYRNVSETEAFESVCNLYGRCVSVEGDFVMLWHNTTMFGELKSWYENVYLRFLKSLKINC